MAEQTYGDGATQGKQIAETLLAYGIGDTRSIASIGNYKVFLQSASVSSEGDVKNYKDNIGQTVSMVIPERYFNVSGEGILVKDGANGDMPKKGDLFTPPSGVDWPDAGDGQWRVESFSVQWQNEDAAKVSFQARLYSF